jgi:hypothetical protein
MSSCQYNGPTSPRTVFEAQNASPSHSSSSKSRAMAKEEAPKVTPVYIRSADHSWVPALQLKTLDGKATVSVPKFSSGEKDMLQCLKASKQFPYQANNQSVDLKEYPNSLLPVQNVDSNGNLEDYKDMVDLPFMHEVRICRTNLKFLYPKVLPIS